MAISNEKLEILSLNYRSPTTRARNAVQQVFSMNSADGGVGTFLDWLETSGALGIISIVLVLYFLWWLIA